MRVFVSGVAGFLGSHLADASLADRHEVVGCDNLTGGYQHGPLRRAGDDPFTEDMTPRPQDPYGIGKLSPESFLRNLAAIHGRST